MSSLGGTSAARYQRLLEPILGQAASYAIAIVRNRADAEDAVQEAATKGYQAFSRYDPDRPFKGWWFTILRNCCRDLVRGRKRSRATSLAALDVAAQPPREEPWEVLAHALDRLSPAHRQILTLRYFGDCSYRDIAAALDIPEGTVMSRLHAARQMLASVYRQEAP
jgi:RNA polymerase sigma-70 factor (ECF subfamily)